MPDRAPYLCAIKSSKTQLALATLTASGPCSVGHSTRAVKMAEGPFTNLVPKHSFSCSLGRPQYCCLAIMIGPSRKAPELQGKRDSSRRRKPVTNCYGCACTAQCSLSACAVSSSAVFMTRHQQANSDHKPNVESRGLCSSTGRRSPMRRCSRGQSSLSAVHCQVIKLQRQTLAVFGAVF